MFHPYLCMCVIYVIGRDLLCLASLRLGLVRLNSVCKLIHIAISAMFISKIFFIYQDGIPVLLNFQWLIVVISFRVLPLARVATPAPPPPQSPMFVQHSVTFWQMLQIALWNHISNERIKPISCQLNAISIVVFPPLFFFSAVLFRFPLEIFRFRFTCRDKNEFQ